MQLSNSDAVIVTQLSNIDDYRIVMQLSNSMRIVMQLSNSDAVIE